MTQGKFLYTIAFELASDKAIVRDQPPPFPFRSINLLRKCDSPDDSLTKRYRARNQFIMARQHIQMLLPVYNDLSQKSKLVSKVWKTRDNVFDAYFKYLASLDTLYLEDYAKRQVPARPALISYRRTCESSYGKMSSSKKQEFKVVKFRSKRARVPIIYNNLVFGLKVEDVLNDINSKL